MAAQYDSITQPYNATAELPARVLETTSIVNALKPIIKGKRVLDFACGSGHVTRMAVDLGAASVLGVDISPKMIDSAHERNRPEDLEKITYEIHDCTIPRVFDGAPFDIVTALYGLNYATNSVELKGMFELVAQNLAPGGTFVGIVPTAFDDLESIARRSEDSRSIKYGVSWETKETVGLPGKTPEGYRIIVIGHAKPEPVRLDTIILLKGVYDQAARDGGLEGKSEWRPLAWDDKEMNKKLGVEDASYWDVSRSSPHASLLVILN